MHTLVLGKAITGIDAFGERLPEGARTSSGRSPRTPDSSVAVAPPHHARSEPVGEGPCCPHEHSRVSSGNKSRVNRPLPGPTNTWVPVSVGMAFDRPPRRRPSSLQASMRHIGAGGLCRTTAEELHMSIPLWRAFCSPFSVVEVELEAASARPRTRSTATRPRARVERHGGPDDCRPGGAARLRCLGSTEAIVHTAIDDAVNAVQGEPFTQFACGRSCTGRPLPMRQPRLRR